jgi:predicted DNA binding protein
VLVAAQAVGYYEVPRAGGIEAVADELDCAVSTASALVRRAESTLVAYVLDGQY